MMRKLRGALAVLMGVHASAAPAAVDLKWLDRSLAQYFVSSHPSDGLYSNVKIPPQPTDFFRRTIFTVSPRDYGPDAPVRKFITEDFERELRHWAGAHHENRVHLVLDELEMLMALESIPTRLTAEEFARLLKKPRAARFSKISDLPEPMATRRQLLEALRTDFGVVTVRQAIRSLRSTNARSVAVRWDYESAEILRQAIDRHLAKDGEWEFCDRSLIEQGAVPREYLEKLGYRII